MKLSKKAYYGLRAALALQQAKGPISIHALAEKESIPAPYLEKILQTLRAKGVVVAERGTKGGYLLAQKNTSAWDVVAALDGPLKIFLPAKGTLPCLQLTHCQTNIIFRDLEKAAEKTLQKTLLKNFTPLQEELKNRSTKK
jgi:Rrf2 family protein